MAYMAPHDRIAPLFALRLWDRKLAAHMHACMPNMDDLYHASFLFWTLPCLFHFYVRDITILQTPFDDIDESEVLEHTDVQREPGAHLGRTVLESASNIHTRYSSILWSRHVTYARKCMHRQICYHLQCPPTGQLASPASHLLKDATSIPSFTTKASFRCEKILNFATVALSFVYGKYCPIID